MGDILLTQEIGSLARHSMFKEKLSKEEIDEIINEGKDLGVENLEYLKDLLLKGGYKIFPKEMENFASLYAIKLFEKVGLDILFNGEQPRMEMYQYPILFIEGIKPVGYVRVFDLQYFLKGEVQDIPKLKKPYHLEEFLFVKNHTKKKIKIPITGPYTLADWSFNLYYQRKWIGKLNNYYKEKYEAKREFTLDLAKNIIRENIKVLVENGAEIIQIDEPAATTISEEVPLVVEAFNEATKGINCKFTMHVCFSKDYKLLFPHILEAKNLKQLALEFANRDKKELGIDDNIRKGYSFLKDFSEYSDKLEIGLGVVDVHVDYIEPVELIKDRISYAIKVLKDPERIFVNPDCGLRTRSWKIARAKLENMVKAVRILKQNLVVG
jgi:5-methyltetrahydropteroyltriglutamate--homocysteine methyltransferase